jgi:hypothetical protein
VQPTLAFPLNLTFSLREKEQSNQRNNKGDCRSVLQLAVATSRGLFASKMYGDLVQIDVRLLQSMKLSRVFLLGVGVVAATTVACTSGTADPVQTDATATSSGQAVDSAGAYSGPLLDIESFVEINPDPEIRPLDLNVDLGFYDGGRIPRDAITPIYTPKFVAPDEVSLRREEMVMGLVINGDVRAYPVGMMRVREMVNDVVGGEPVLVTW